ncbi:hypothetical protein BV898_01607 [Hypsibius exemplaris]|uniref:Uncharacterized protein n=1 Tax=Hypsibius exemplaris TaxID=2072580 RepID=A0A1W0XAK1_HYPEX|nr:hypothetical protein BV898_01607 [Hypsibius exemplaris]
MNPLSLSLVLLLDVGSAFNVSLQFLNIFSTYTRSIEEKTPYFKAWLSFKSHQTVDPPDVCRPAAAPPDAASASAPLDAATAPPVAAAAAALPPCCPSIPPLPFLQAAHRGVKEGFHEIFKDPSPGRDLQRLLSPDGDSEPAEILTALKCILGGEDCEDDYGNCLR